MFKERKMDVIYFLVCGLFNDAVSSSDYISSDDRMIKGKRFATDMEGCGSGLI
jgi:hypothetical protein